MESGKSNTVLRQAPDNLSGVQIEASARLERRQLEMLLMHALKISGGDFSYIVSPVGEGAYAEQFVKIDAAVVRTKCGSIEVAPESLNSRRADPSTQSVIRHRNVVNGSILVHGIPLHFPNLDIPVTHFVQIPIENGANNTSVLFVANPGIAASGNLQGDILSRLQKLGEAIAQRQQRQQAASRNPDLSASSEESVFKLMQLKKELNHAVVTVNTAGVIRSINPCAEKLIGCGAGQALGMTLDRYLAPKYFVSTLQRVESWSDDKNETRMSAMSHRHVSILAEGGQTRKLNASAYYVKGDKEKRVSFVLSVPASEKASVNKTNALELPMNTSSMGVIRLDAGGLCEHVSDLWCQLSGQKFAEAKGLGWTNAIHAEDIMDIWLEIGSIVDKGQPYAGKIRLHRLDGSIRQVVLSASIVSDESGRVAGFVIVFQDVTTHYCAQQHIDYAVEHDVLTGLVNRSTYLNRLQLRLNNRHLRNKTALLHIVLKGVKPINASAGQHAGDEVLRQAAKRLILCAGSDALGARINGNEFSMILLQANDPIEIGSIAERMVKSIKERFLVFGDVLHLTATVGISLGDETTSSSDLLAKQASEALNVAAMSKLRDWYIYSQKSCNQGAEQLRLTERIRLAVVNREFTLDYQPQYSLEKDEIVSFEALLRWVPLDIPVPDTTQLIKELEGMGLIAEVGLWILETACQQFMIWKEIGLLAKGCTMSVNIAPAQLMNADFPKQISIILAHCRMSSCQLNLEIAESDWDENSMAAHQVVDELKRMGVRLSLSAFGTGKASLSHLNSLPIDFLKIDRSFVMAMDTHEPSRSMIMSVLAMANTLDIDVVAEGIESTVTLGRLKAAQCKYVQGNLISKAKSASFLEPMLVRRNYKSEDMLQLG